MSFPRAKLKRFNEEQSCTPSPADYNPIVKPSNGGSIKSTSGRFPENQVDNVSVNSNGSSCFKTPSMLRKKKPGFNSASKVKPTSLFVVDDSETLKDKIVECNNKDLYIKELMEQIEDMKSHLKELIQQRDLLEKEKQEFETRISDMRKKHSDDLFNVTSLHDNDMNKLNITINKVNQELRNLQEQHDMIKQKNKVELENLLESINALGHNFNAVTSKVFDEEIKRREDELIEKGNALKMLKTDLEEKHREEIEKLTTLHATEIKNIEYEMLRTITETEKKLEREKQIYLEKVSEIEEKKNFEIAQMQESHKIVIENMIENKQKEIEQLEEKYKEINCLTVIQMQEKCMELESTWKLKLEERQQSSEETLRKFQTDSEANIIQIEVEKNRINKELAKRTQELDELKTQLTSKTDLETKFEQLKHDYDNIITTLEETRKNLETEKSAHETEKKQLIINNRTYQITIAKTNEAVDALKKRLLESDRDVEQLKLEIETNEAAKLKLESKCNHYQDACEGLRQINEQLVNQQEIAEKLYQENLRKVEKKLSCETDEYKKLVENVVNSYDKRLNKKEVELKTVSELLREQQFGHISASNLIDAAREEIENLEGENTNMKHRVDSLKKELSATNESISKIKKKCCDLELRLKKEIESNNQIREELQKSETGTKDVDRLKGEVKQLQEKSEKYLQYTEYYKSKSVEYEKEIEQMGKINKSYKDQSRKYDELLKRYSALEQKNIHLEKTVIENELLIGPFREQLEAYENEKKVLLSQKSVAENEAKSMSLKYAEILGHQNQKQKIKHLVDLKEKNIELAKVNQSMEAKLNKQAKTIDKLKKRLGAETPKKLKENMNSPRGSIYISSPLRDRNQS